MSASAASPSIASSVSNSGGVAVAAAVLGDQVAVLQHHDRRLGGAGQLAGVVQQVEGSSGEQDGGGPRRPAEQMAYDVGLAGPRRAVEQDPTFEVLAGRPQLVAVAPIRHCRSGRGRNVIAAPGA